MVRPDDAMDRLRSGASRDPSSITTVAFACGRSSSLSKETSEHRMHAEHGQRVPGSLLCVDHLRHLSVAGQVVGGGPACMPIWTKLRACCCQRAKHPPATTLS